MPEDDAATTQIVGREFDDHSVGRNDADVVLPHLAADGRQDPMPISQFNSEHGVGQGFDDGSLEFEGAFLLRHYSQSLILRGRTPAQAQVMQGSSLVHARDTPQIGVGSEGAGSLRAIVAAALSLQLNR